MAKRSRKQQEPAQDEQSPPLGDRDQSSSESVVGFNPPPAERIERTDPTPAPPVPVTPDVQAAIAAAVAQAMQTVVPSISQMMRDVAERAGRKPPAMNTDARGLGQRPTMGREIPVYTGITIHDALNFVGADRLLFTDSIPLGDALLRAFTVLARSGIRRGLVAVQGQEGQEKPAVEQIEQREINKQFGEYMLSLLEEPLPAPMPLAHDNIGFDSTGHHWKAGEGYIFRNDAVVLAPRKLGEEPPKSIIPDMQEPGQAREMNERDATIERRF